MASTVGKKKRLSAVNLLVKK